MRRPTSQVLNLLDQSWSHSCLFNSESWISQTLSPRSLESGRRDQSLLLTESMACYLVADNTGCLQERRTGLSLTLRGPRPKLLSFCLFSFLALHFIRIVVNFWLFCWSNLILTHFALFFGGFSDGSAGKEFTCNVGDLGSIPGLGRSPGQGNGYPLQYSVLRIPWTTVHEVTKSQKWLDHFHLVMLWGVGGSDLWSYLLWCFH